jgi:hypothetical protein
MANSLKRGDDEILGFARFATKRKRPLISFSNVVSLKRVWSYLKASLGIFDIDPNGWKLSILLKIWWNHEIKKGSIKVVLDSPSQF